MDELIKLYNYYTELASLDNEEYGEMNSILAKNILKIIENYIDN